MLQSISEIFTGTRKKVATHATTVLLSELKILRSAIMTIDTESDPINGIVHFFNLISHWDDRGLSKEIDLLHAANKKGLHDKQIGTLRTLDTLFGQSGRHEYGWNRTKNGEQVTLDNVFLGNVDGIWTKTARIFLALKDDEYRPHGDVTIYETICHQARNFVNTNRGMIVDTIDEIERLIEQPTIN